MSSYKPELDGMRAVSILLVIISHAGFGDIVPGGLGVTIFFLISGYLITSLLIEEISRNKSIDLYRFYMRRFWRLLPPVFFFMLISVAIILNVNGGVILKELAAAVFYVANYYKIFFHFTNVGSAPSPFNILWSLAIEEHFYIIFAPLLAFTFFSRKYIAVVFVFLIIPLLIRIASVRLDPSLLMDGGYNYSATEARLDTIAFGCLLAIVGSDDNYVKLKRWVLKNTVFGVALILLLLTLIYRDLYFRETYRYTIQNISLFLIIGYVLYSGSYFAKYVRELFSLKIPVFLGKLSYSLYLQHWLALILATIIIGNVRLEMRWQILYWMVTVVLSLMSYYLVERPTLKFRRNFGSNI